MHTDDFIKQYWQSIVQQDKEKLRVCFCTDALICWHNSNEQFDVEDFLRANCEYPGQWNGEMERLEQAGETVITAMHIWSKEASFHVTSFFTLQDGKIKTLDEYWGDDGEPPQWRTDMHIGNPIPLCKRKGE